MPKSSRQREIATSGCTLFFALATFLTLCLGAASPVRAQPLLPCPNPADTTICTMTIQIFNNDPNHWIYPVLTTGKGPVDIWMQAWFSVTTSQLPSNPYPRRKNYRLYINPSGAGIPPNTGITLTLPLFTQLQDPINPNPPACQPASCTDTFVDWWNGATILLYVNTSPTPQGSLRDALARPTQQVVTVNSSSAISPTCVAVQSAGPSPPPAPTCQTLTIYSDDSDLPKADGNQLLEYTLGARNDPSPDNAAKGIVYALDTRNVDFDVSYVNVAFAPAVMGVYKNDQIGYTGTPKTVDDFRSDLTQFVQDFSGWPQFVKIFDNIPLPPATPPKYASPLEVFARLGGKDAPTDLTAVPDPMAKWPTSLWKPIAALRTGWTTYAGTVTGNSDGSYTTTNGTCGPIPAPGAAVVTFCDAIVAVKGILLLNYANYRSIFSTKCAGLPVVVTDNLLIQHAYGWGPWTESATSNPNDGCPAAVNLLQDTPGYFTIVDRLKNTKDYTNYLTVKTGFDRLNYGLLPMEGYSFNPWVKLIHGDQSTNPVKYINTKCAYAYSVDDALGNVQAEGQGFIVDVGSTINLENQTPCSAPIQISLGYSVNDPIRFTQYAICDTTADRIRPINPAFPAFVISSNNPAGCPVYVWDNKATPQLYTFTVNVTAATLDQMFPFFQHPTSEWQPIKWIPFPPPNPVNGYPPGSTAFPIKCGGNTPPILHFNPRAQTGAATKSSRPAYMHIHRLRPWLPTRRRTISSPRHPLHLA
jgi:hypothetical protein